MCCKEKKQACAYETSNWMITSTGSNPTTVHQKTKNLELDVGINLILHKYRIGLKFKKNELTKEIFFVYFQRERDFFWLRHQMDWIHNLYWTKYVFAIDLMLCELLWLLWLLYPSLCIVFMCWNWSLIVKLLIIWTCHVRNQLLLISR